MRNTNHESRLARIMRRRRSFEPDAYPSDTISIDEVMADLEFPGPVRWIL